MTPGTTLQAVFDSLPTHDVNNLQGETRYGFVKRSSVYVVGHKDHVEFSAKGEAAIKHMIKNFGEPTHRTDRDNPAWNVNRDGTTEKSFDELLRTWQP